MVIETRGPVSLDEKVEIMKCVLFNLCEHAPWFMTETREIKELFLDRLREYVWSGVWLVDLHMILIGLVGEVEWREI